MRGHVEYDIFEIPVDGHFRGMGRPPGFDFPGHHGHKPGFGPFGGHGFDHSPERFRHGGPGCGRRGSPNRGCGRHSPVRHGEYQHGPDHHKNGPPGGFECGRRGPPHHGCDGHSPIRHGDHGPDHGAEGRRCGAEGPVCRRGSLNRGCGEHSPARHEGNHGPEHHRRGPPDDGHYGPGYGHHGPPHDCKNHSPARYGPDHHTCGLPERGHRRPHGGRPKSPGCHCGRPSERHCFGRPGRRHGPGPHGPWFRHSPERHCFGRHGPSEFPEHPWGGSWKGPWGFDHHRPGFGRHGPCRPGFGPRPCPYNILEGRSSRNADCEKCRETEPCCSKNKGNRGRDGGRKENGPCNQWNKEQNPTGDTVFVQRIVLENAPRPQSI